MPFLFTVKTAEKMRPKKSRKTSHRWFKRGDVPLSSFFHRISSRVIYCDGNEEILEALSHHRGGPHTHVLIAPGELFYLIRLRALDSFFFFSLKRLSRRRLLGCRQQFFFNDINNRCSRVACNNCCCTKRSAVWVIFFFVLYRVEGFHQRRHCSLIKL